MGKRKPRGYWNEETIGMELEKRLQEGKSIECKEVRKSDTGLYLAGNKLYGDWISVLRYYGYEAKQYRERKDRHYRNGEEVVNQLKKLRDSGFNLRPFSINKTDDSLMRWSITYFGSYEKALEQAGIKYRELLERGDIGYWDKKRVMDELLKREQQAKNMSATRLHQEDISLYRQVLKYYKSYETAMNKLKVIKKQGTSIQNINEG